MKKRDRIMFAVLLLFAVILVGCIVSVDNVNNNNITSISQVATTSQNKQIQQKLKDLGYYFGSVDGIYGNATRNAVVAFQKANGLTADGVAGPKTIAALGLNFNSVTSSDLYLLAKCVHAEARGEPYVGQVAVAAVILNRVKDAAFPNTISGVIYQPWAFTAVNDGQINLEPNSTAYQAAQDALNGWDPTYGCLYYYNPTTATSKWIFSRQTVVTIGKHVFAI
mgnify:FL=1